LRWDRYTDRWTFAVRALPKMGVQEVRAIVGPLGELAAEGDEARPRFVGYIDDETLDRPVPIWSTGAQPFSFEALDEGV
jgi:hypothetical protein